MTKQEDAGCRMERERMFRFALKLIAPSRHNGGRIADPGILTGLYWQYYVIYPPYWREWMKLNRN